MINYNVFSCSLGSTYVAFFGVAMTPSTVSVAGNRIKMRETTVHVYNFTITVRARVTTLCYDGVLKGFVTCVLH